MNEIYMPRMPQVGERWRLRARPNEECVCSTCGVICGGVVTEGKRLEDFNGQAVEVIRNGNLVITCQNCYGETEESLWITVKGRFDTTRKFMITVPYTWLEPLEAQP